MKTVAEILDAVRATHVKEHTMITKTGKVAVVKEHEDSRIGDPLSDSERKARSEQVKKAGEEWIKNRHSDNRQEVEHEGKKYHFNKSTGRWHDSKGEPTSFHHAALNAKANERGNGTADDSRDRTKPRPLTEDQRAALREHGYEAKAGKPSVHSDSADERAAAHEAMYPNKASHRTAADVLRATAPPSSNPRVNEILGIEPVRAGAPVGNQNAAGKHAHDASAIAEAKTREASNSASMEKHMDAWHAHKEARNRHEGAAVAAHLRGNVTSMDFSTEKNDDIRSNQKAEKEHSEKAEYHSGYMAHHMKLAQKFDLPTHATDRTPSNKVQASDATPEEDAVTARASDVVHCRSASDILGAIQASDRPWKQGEETSFMYMPSGQHTICAGFRGHSVLLTVNIDPERDTQVVQASFQKLVSKYPKQKPFGCIEHEEKDASVWAKGFEAKADGIYLAAEPSALGENHVNGKIHRSWSPSFLTDADYKKAVLKEYPSGKVYEFPAGVRGSEQNPARITGVTFCVGTLTNNPAFKEIDPVRAKEMATIMNEPVRAGAPIGNKNAAGMHHTQLAYAEAKAKHDVIHDRVKEEHAKMVPPNDGAPESEWLQHYEKMGAIEDQHGYWDAKQGLRKAEDEMISAAKDHTVNSPEYKAQSEENQKGIAHAFEKGPKSYNLRPKLVDLAFKLRHNTVKASSATPDPDKVTATWSNAAREAAKEAKSEKAAGYHRKAMESEDGITRTAHYASANAHESGSIQMHKVAESVHRQARDHHLDNGNQEQAQEHEFHRAQHSAHASATSAKVKASSPRTVDAILAGAKPGNQNADKKCAKPSLDEILKKTSCSPKG